MVEQTALGLHHAEIGASFCAHWQMSEIQANAVRHHHQPDHPEAHPLAAVIHLADYLAHSSADQDPRDVEYSLSKLRLAPEDLDYLRDEMTAAVADAGG